MTNQVIEGMHNRRSARAYEPKSIPKEIINMIIEAGNHAPCMPSAEEGEILFQPWRFVVVQNPEFKQKLVQTVLPIWKNFMENIKETNPQNYGKMMRLYEAMEEPKDTIYYSAPVIIFVIGPTDNAISCALTCENIILAAHSLGLGSCYVAFGSMVKGNADVMQALELKENERIYGPIVLGYPKDMPEARAILWEKKDPIIKWI